MKLVMYDFFTKEIYSKFLENKEDNVSFLGPSDFNNLEMMSKIGHSMIDHYSDFPFLIMISSSYINYILDEFLEFFRRKCYLKTEKIIERNFVAYIINEVPIAKGILKDDKLILFIQEGNRCNPSNLIPLDEKYKFDISISDIKVFLNEI